MCGISGYFVQKPERVRPEAIQLLAGNLLRGIENRGRDATGYAYVSRKDSKRATFVCKAPVAASDFLRIEGHLLTKKSVSAMPRAMLLHTRYATQGKPEDNRNNHPVISKESGLCLVHNGWFVDDDAVIEAFDLKKDAEVDTETYLRLIEKFYLQGETKTVESGIQQATRNVWGSIACAMIQGGRPGTMWLWRDQGALELAMTDWGFVFASTKSALLEALYGSCKSIDLSWHELLHVPRNTLITLKDGMIEPKVYRLEEADWNSAPNNVSAKVITYKSNGETVVKRSRGGTRQHFDISDEELEEYYNGYGCGLWQGYEHDKQTVDHAAGPYGHAEHRGQFLPGFSRSGSPASNSGQASSSDSNGSKAAQIGEANHQPGCICKQCFNERHEKHRRRLNCGWKFCLVCNPASEETTH